MVTPARYAAGTTAARAIIEADIDKDVPLFFRDEIPDSAIDQLAADTAKAVLDAAEKVTP